MFYLYCITTPSSKSYIGYSRKPNERWQRHAENKSAIGNALRKYGTDNCSFKVLLIVSKQDEACEYERKLVKAYATLSPNGYNLTEGGEGARLCEASRKLIGDALRGRKRPELALKMTGRKASLETRRRISESHKEQVPWNKGLKHSDEHRAHLSAAQRGKPRPWRLLKCYSLKGQHVQWHVNRRLIKSDCEFCHSDRLEQADDGKEQ